MIYTEAEVNIRQSYLNRLGQLTSRCIEIVREFIVGAEYKQLAEDVTQSALLRAVRSIDRYDPDKGSLENWLFEIAKNEARNQIDKANTVKRHAERVGRRPFNRINSSVEAGEAKDLRKEMIASLPPGEYEELFLNNGYGVSHKEIAVRDGNINVNGSKIRAHRQKPRARSVLEAKFTSEEIAAAI